MAIELVEACVPWIYARALDDTGSAAVFYSCAPEIEASHVTVSFATDGSATIGFYVLSPMENGVPGAVTAAIAHRCVCFEAPGLNRDTVILDAATGKAATLEVASRELYFEPQVEDALTQLLHDARPVPIRAWRQHGADRRVRGASPDTARMPPFDLSDLDRDIIRLALRGDANMKRYVPEVMRVCALLDIDEPPWLQDEDVAERVALNREQWPKRR